MHLTILFWLRLQQFYHFLWYVSVSGFFLHLPLRIQRQYIHNAPLADCRVSRKTQFRAHFEGLPDRQRRDQLVKLRYEPHKRRLVSQRYGHPIICLLMVSLLLFSFFFFSFLFSFIFFMCVKGVSLPLSLLFLLFLSVLSFPFPLPRLHA